jgi:hypothetical protein
MAVGVGSLSDCRLIRKEKTWEKGHTLLPSCLSRATINQGVEIVVGVSHRGRGQKNSEKLHAGRY